MKILFTFLFVFAVKSLTAQYEIIPEQAALNFFINKIWPAKYPNIKTIYYRGVTDSAISTPIGTCKELDSIFIDCQEFKLVEASTKILVDNLEFKPTYSPTQTITNDELKHLKKSTHKKYHKLKKRQAYLMVYNKFNICSTNIIDFLLYFHDYSTEVIVIILDKKNNLIYWCAY